ncbi:acyltransferase [Enterococcus faecium]|uniref:acyltransferase n=1 Tax=Enterococcus faecium TaxID=1352 RepID=UPI002954660C|nr:acyltransferase [Enterococcus faecium]MDV7750674.1 acyltransferase [Enterococcus faecium]
MGNNKRLIYIDYLKVIGLFLVILAHVDCPKFLMQIRSFDVPLLVFISGYLAAKSYKQGNSYQYYLKRIKRLAVPAWLFLIVFFVIQTIVYSRPGLVDIVKGFLFQKDANMVGMLWVIWVYLVCAFLIPMISRFKYTKKSVFLAGIVFLIYEIVCIFTNLANYRILYVTVFTVVPWGVLTFWSFYYDCIPAKRKYLFAILFACIFLGIASMLRVKTGSFVMTNDYKYPARLYYLSFAMPIIIIIYEFLKRINLPKSKIISFISKSSLWIYLWHILVLYVVKSIITNDALWALQYVCIICISLAITWIQNIIVTLLIDKYRLNFMKVFLG